MYIVTNIDGIIKRFSTDTLFLQYTRWIAKENEDSNMDINDIKDAIFYITAYCDNLNLKILYK